MSLPTLLDSNFPCPEKPECEDSGLEALSKGFGGDVWPGCPEKLTKRKTDNTFDRAFLKCSSLLLYVALLHHNPEGVILHYIYLRAIATSYFSD